MPATAPAAGTGRARMAHRVRRLMVHYAPTVLVLVGLVVFWEVWVEWRDVRPFLFPAPTEIWDAFLSTRATLPGHARTTMTEAGLGLLLAATVGVVLSVILVSLPLTRRIIYPLLVVSQNIPLIVLAPLMIVWFGLGITPKVVLVALVGFFPIVVSTTDALLRVDRDYVDLVRSMGANRFQVLWNVLIPGGLPGFFAGLKISASYAVLAAVFAEWIAAQSGLGLYISRSDNAYKTDQVFVGVVIVALTSVALFALVNLLARLASPWMYVNDQQEDQ